MNLAGVLDHLERLVAFDTQNPPRSLAADAPVFGWLAGVLGTDFAVEMIDHGHGRVSMLAVRGEPSLLFNCHLDTVPVLEGARYPALELTRDGDRVYGRGACDIKGAAACLVEVARSSRSPLALLFTTDEEGANGCCVAEFLRSGRAEQFTQVVVAEPTECLAITSHRGYLSVKGRFGGIAGHSSEARALRDNAIHKLSSWVAAAVEQTTRLEGEGRRSCFNVGVVSGGVKSNVIADSADIHWSARLPPGTDNDEFLALMTGLDTSGAVRWQVPFAGPPLPTGGMDTARAEMFVERHGLDAGATVDFWTEASLFAQAGLPAIVLGPGNIAQAHAVDEWVSLEQLQRALKIYIQLVKTDD